MYSEHFVVVVVYEYFKQYYKDPLQYCKQKPKRNKPKTNVTNIYYS